MANGADSLRSSKRRKIANDSPTKSDVKPTPSPSVVRSARRALKVLPSKLSEPSKLATEAAEPQDANQNVSEGPEKTPSGRRSFRSRKQEAELQRGVSINPSTDDPSGNEGPGLTTEVMAIDEHTEQSQDPIAVRSSGRQRKRPRRFSKEIGDAMEVKRLSTKTSTPKAQTSARNTEQDEIGISDVQTASIGKELGFKDIEGSTKKKGRTPTNKKRQKAASPPPEFDTGAAVSKDVDMLDVPDDEAITPRKSKRKPKATPVKAERFMMTEEDLEAQRQEEIPVAIPDLLEPANIQPNPVPETATEDVDEDTSLAFGKIQRIVVSRITGRRRTPLVALDEEFRKVQHVAEQTVTAGESNSMLIIGPRGSGKTTLIEMAVSDLQKQYAHEFHVIRLNGFFQTDDRLALREIWRQLGREMDTEEDANKVSSYADTMASLLALLSQPEELLGPLEDGKSTKSILFIIDEFDLFATHPRQTLLYNLFDIAQSRKAPIAVFGLSTKVDAVEHLEKRVKSRFSHRYVYLQLAKNLSIFTDMCKSGLVVSDEDLQGETDETLRSAQQTWNTHVEVSYKFQKPLYIFIRSP